MRKTIKQEIEKLCEIYFYDLKNYEEFQDGEYLTILFDIYLPESLYNEFLNELNFILGYDSRFWIRIVSRENLNAFSFECERKI